MVNVKPTTLDMARAVTELQEAQDAWPAALSAHDNNGEPFPRAAADRLRNARELVVRNLAYQRERAGVIERGKFTTGHVRDVLTSLGADANTTKVNAQLIAHGVRNTFG